MTDDKKPREFWVFSKQSELHSIEQGGFDNEDIYVIEHSAYDALAKENEELNKKYRSIQLANENMSRNDHVHFGDLLLERDSLRESLKLAVEALNNHQNVFCSVDSPTDPIEWTSQMLSAVEASKKALATIKAKHGEL